MFAKKENVQKKRIQLNKLIDRCAPSIQIASILRFCDRQIAGYQSDVSTKGSKILCDCIEKHFNRITLFFSNVFNLLRMKNSEDNDTPKRLCYMFHMFYVTLI